MRWSLWDCGPLLQLWEVFLLDQCTSGTQSTWKRGSLVWDLGAFGELSAEHLLCRESGEITSRLPVLSYCP